MISKREVLLLARRLCVVDGTMFVKMCNSRNIKGYCAVIGGILIHLTLGNLYSFGNMMTYMASYLHERVDTSVTYSNIIWINSITTAAQGCFMVLGGLMETCIGPRITCFIGCSLLSGGIMLTKYSIDVGLISVSLTYGLLAGLGISLAYATPLACGMKWYPGHKGLINGLIVAGFGLGALGSTFFQTYYLNPHNYPPDDSGYFTDAYILDRVPSVFIALGLIFIAMQYTGCILINKPTDQEIKESWPQQERESLLRDEALRKGGKEMSEGESETDEEVKQKQNAAHNKNTITPKLELKPSEVIKHKYFYIFWLIYFFNTIAVGYINAMYKSYGQTFISDDHYLAQIGSFAAIFNAVGRICWGRFMDKTSFRISMRVLTVILMVLYGTMPATSYMGKFGYTVWVWAIFFTFSGTFVLMPTVIEKTFGSQHYSANYGLLFTSQTLSGPLIAGVNELLLSSVGYTGCFVTISAVISLSVIMTFLVPKDL